VRGLVAIAVAAVVLIGSVQPVSAQVHCDAGALTQYDLAGYYEAVGMAVSVYPCGGSYVEWRNEYGTHGATYVTVMHLSDGVVARGMTSTTGYLDGSLAIGYKAADPGYIQVFTDGPFGSRVYRLRKMY
jgi:hypothetical protein